MNPIVRIELKFLAAIIVLAALSALTAPKAHAAPLRIDAHGVIQWNGPHSHGVGVDPKLLARARDCSHQAGGMATGFVLSEYGPAGLNAAAQGLVAAVLPGQAAGSGAGAALAKAFPPSLSGQALVSAGIVTSSGDPMRDWASVANIAATDCLMRKDFPSSAAGFLEQKSEMQHWVREWIAQRGA